MHVLSGSPARKFTKFIINTPRPAEWPWYSAAVRWEQEWPGKAMWRHCGLTADGLTKLWNLSWMVRPPGI